jgi:hypothetical protein
VTGAGGVVEFLLARLAEDEAVAKAASPAPWTSRDEDGFYSYGDFGWYIVGPTGAPETEDSEQGKADLDHIARHDPARVLAQVEALRAVVNRPACDDAPDCGDPECAVIVEDRRILAGVHRDHPDFHPSWLT